MTSVKDVRVETPAASDSLGRGTFVFTDAYSVFDWGRMPDAIPDKGAALCTMGARNFEHLAEEGVPTHYRGVGVDGAVQPLEAALAADTQPHEMAIDLATVPDLPFVDGAYDYEAYHTAAGSSYLVPLEIVFRNRVGVGSSLRTRTQPGDHGLEYAEWPAEPVELDEPIVEFSTKFESQDRYLEPVAADRIAGRADVEDLASIARQVNRIVTERAESAGLGHLDGKIECLYHDGEVRVADVVGTFDENRFAYDGQQVSKEVLRQYHKRTQPEWVDAVTAAKERAKQENIDDWRSLCDRSPEPLAPAVVEAARDLYCAGTNAYLDRGVFDAPALEAAVTAVRDL